MEGRGSRVSKSDVDPVEGTFPVKSDTGTYDLIVVGGGIAGLSCAFWALRPKPTAKVLILENNPRLGGVSSRDDASPVLPTHASAAAAYCAFPYDQFLFDFYDGIGLEWRDNLLAGPEYAYFFDSFMPPASRSVWTGETKWVLDVYTSQGIDNMPFTGPVRQDLHNARQDFRNWYNRGGSPTDPPDNSDPKFDFLAHKSLHEYLTVDMGFHPAVTEFYDQYASDALACRSPFANAYTSISFLGAEYFDQFIFPGGNSFVARRALKFLIPASITGTTYNEILNNPINTAELDKPANRARYRMGANALRVTTGSTGATVEYHLGGEFFRASCKAVALHGQMHTAHRLTEHQMSSEQLAAAGKYQHIPIPIANVAVRNSQFLVNAGSAYDYYWYGSEF